MPNLPSEKKIKIIIRILLDILLIVVAITFKWWVTLAFAFFLIFFNKQHEAVIAGLILDIIYGNNTFYKTFFGEYLYTSILLIFVSISFFKSRYISK